jgi:pyruvate dehydrogenase E2 component (dihydrolipoamide acetyltransferase)
MIRADLVKRAREEKLKIDEMSGSTFTITNMGMLGIEYGYPVINHPEASILWLGGIKERPAVIDGVIKPVLSMNITIASDHRVLDGWIQAQFLNRIRDMIENPILMIK